MLQIRTFKPFSEHLDTSMIDNEKDKNSVD